MLHASRVGMLYPKNLQTAMEVEAIVRDNGAIPATIAILDGVPHVGQLSASSRASSTCTDVHLGMSSDIQIDGPSPRCGGQSRRGKPAGCVLQLLLADCTELMVPACYCDPSRWPATIAAAVHG